ncbi:hypothetical protein NBRC116586_17900 [Pseudooceanicola nitratireducens]
MASIGWVMVRAAFPAVNPRNSAWAAAGVKLAICSILSRTFPDTLTQHPRDAKVRRKQTRVIPGRVPRPPDRTNIPSRPRGNRGATRPPKRAVQDIECASLRLPV